MYRVFLNTNHMEMLEVR